VVMKIENISHMRMVRWPEKISDPATVRENQRSPQNDTSDEVAEADIMFTPTSKRIWPRVWPGL
jgi:hypothetical protein